MSTNTKTLGICQCCGRQQAVLTSGRMSKHGYTVDHGWFSGVCSGQHFAPLEKDRTQADNIILDIREKLIELEAELVKVQQGKWRTAEITVCRKYMGQGEWKVLTKLWGEATQYERDRATDSEKFRIEQRIRAGRSFAQDLSELADKYHGKPLRSAPKPAQAARIQKGEKRRSSTSILTLEALYQDGGRVYWKAEQPGGKVLKSWTGTQAWRKLELVA